MAPAEEDSLAAVDILEPIGQGISGTVYKGLWRSKVVAVKVMERVLDKHQAEQEAAVCMTICHPSVVQTHLCVLEQLPAAQQYLDRLHGLQENRQVAELVGVVNTPHYWPVHHQQTTAQTSSCDSSQTQADMYCAVIVMQYCPGGTLWAALQQGHFHNPPYKSDSQAGQKSCCCGVWPCLALPCQRQQTASAEGAFDTALVKRQGQTHDRITHHTSPGADASEHGRAACHNRPCGNIELPQCQTPCADDLQPDNNSPIVSSPRPRLDRILAVAQQIAAALEHVHSQSVVHGDVTSHNVLLANKLTQHGPCVAKLADFGMCTRLQSPGSCQGAFTGDHAVAHGTLMYMPPELLLHGTVSCAVDVYSLSILLWEMYTGQQPYKGLTQAQIIDNKAEGCRDLPLPSSCPSPYVQLCKWCLEVNPCHRPSMSQVRQELSRMQSLKMEVSQQR